MAKYKIEATFPSGTISFRTTFQNSIEDAMKAGMRIFFESECGEFVLNTTNPQKPYAIYTFNGGKCALTARQAA